MSGIANHRHQLRCNMSKRFSPFQAIAAKLHTIHPVVTLAPLAIGAWMIAPTLAISDAGKPDVAAMMKGAWDAARGTAPSAKPAPGDTGTTAGAATTVVTVAPTPAPPTAVVIAPGSSGGSVATGRTPSPFANHFAMAPATRPAPLALPPPYIAAIPVTPLPAPQPAARPPIIIVPRGITMPPRPVFPFGRPMLMGLGGARGFAHR
jgi:hypothetical protein